MPQKIAAKFRSPIGAADRESKIMSVEEANGLRSGDVALVDIRDIRRLGRAGRMRGRAEVA